MRKNQTIDATASSFPADGPVPWLRMALVLSVLCGLLYPATVVGVAQVVFPFQANGSMLEHDGRVVGSALVAQSFQGPAFFHPRPSAIDYDATGVGGLNLGATNSDLRERVAAHAQQIATLEGVETSQIPPELLAQSGSGIDPHITPAAAQFQVARVAQARGVSVEVVTRLVADHTEPRLLGLFGNPRVNVLSLNLALEQLDVR